MKNPRAKNRSADLREKRQLMSASEIDRSLVRLAHEIIERHNGATGLLLLGICRRGGPLAERLANKIADIEKVQVPWGTLDVTSYRDDLPAEEKKPLASPPPLPVSLEDRQVILVDDVLYTGRTTRAALDALVDSGRPRQVELCVLIDRGHRELPIQANYVGKNIQTAEEEVVQVRLREVDGEDRVLLGERVGSGRSRPADHP